MNRIKLVFIILLAVTLCGCAVDLNKTDISSSVVAESMGLDFDSEKGEYTLYLVFTKNNEPDVIKSSGKSISEAFSSLSVSSKKYPLISFAEYFIVSNSALKNDTLSIKAFFGSQNDLRYDALVFSCDDVKTVFSQKENLTALTNSSIRTFLQKKIKRLFNTLGDFLNSDSIYLLNLKATDNTLLPNTISYINDNKFSLSFDENMSLGILLRLDNLLSKTLEYENAILEMYDISYSTDMLSYKVNIYPKSRAEKREIKENSKRHCDSFLKFLLSQTGRTGDIKITSEQYFMG